jgi:hypothetical protein
MAKETWGIGRHYGDGIIGAGCLDASVPKLQTGGQTIMFA